MPFRGAGGVAPTYVAPFLEASGLSAEAAMPSHAMGQPKLIEPLTERELLLFHVPLPFQLLTGWMPGLAAVPVTAAVSGGAGRYIITAIDIDR